MEEKMLVPQMRFPEFEGNWSSYKASSIFTISAGGDIDKQHVSEVRTEKFKYPIYANAKANKGFYSYSDIYKVPANVITVAGRGVYIGIAHARDHKFYPIVRLLVLKPKAELDIQFFEYEINQINLFIESTGVPQLTAPQFGAYKLFYPKYNEQQKIAAFLTSVDKRIQLLQSKKEKLEEYKKGVMQKLFPSKDGQAPEIRFKPALSVAEEDENGNPFPDWEEKKLGGICEITTGKLDANAMVVNGDYRFYTCAKSYSKIDVHAFDFEALLISGNGANVGYVHHYNGKFNAYQRTYVLYNLSECYEFIRYYLDKNLQRRIHREKKDGNTPYIIMSTLTEMKIDLPPYKEQQKIANFLSSIDESIEKVNQQIEGSKEFKKGLLQKMFV